MFIILAVKLDDDSGIIDRVWWRRAERDNSWLGAAEYAHANEVANAIAVGERVFTRISLGGRWVVRPNVVVNVDPHGQEGIHLDGGPDEVDDSMTWLAQNWERQVI
jgi:hypothetical protein